MPVLKCWPPSGQAPRLHAPQVGPPSSWRWQSAAFEAWKGAAARVSARTTLEFTKAWYPNLDLTQLATFRLEAGPELEEVGPELTRILAALADYTNTTVFVPNMMLMAMR